MKKFKTLYKKSQSTGKMCQWSIEVDGATIREEWGQVGGKLQSTSDTIKTGKNIGKANETTPEQQALAEAQSKWEKKMKGEYTDKATDAKAGKTSKLVVGGVLPMLAKRYDEDGDKIVWPAHAQRKYDGHRCIAMIDSEGKASLWSRTRKQIHSMKHLITAIEALGLKDTVLDGELYNLEYAGRFEELTHFIRQTQPVAGCEVVHYHIYDLINDKPFSDRTKELQSILKGAEPCLVPVETFLIEDEGEMLVLFEEFIADGFEGLMIRNAAGLYVNTRSGDLQKVKSFMDSEYEITGVIEGRGKLAGHGIFLCKTEEGTSFEAKMVGDTAKLKEYYEHPEKYIGKMLTVKYQGLTAKSKVPRFPVALRLAESL